MSTKKIRKAIKSPTVKKVPVPKSYPTYVYLDIETFPLVGTAWGAREVDLLDVLEDSIVCAFSAKICKGPNPKHGKQITKILPDYAGYNPAIRDDKALIQELRDILDEADIVVAQNGDQFDVKVVQARIASNHIELPSPFISIDTLKISRKNFRIYSHRLNEIARLLGLPCRKIKHHGYPLWKECMAGVPAAWKLMRKYNAHDVIVLMEVYLAIRAWDRNHPNLSLWKPNTCPKCMADAKGNVESRGKQHNKTAIYNRFYCKACRSWLRVKKSDKAIIELVNG